jgi:hypothetical protein
MTRKINWNAAFSEHETNEEALMRMFNEQDIKKEAGTRSYLTVLASMFETTPMAVNKKLGRLRKEGKVGTCRPGGTWGTKKLSTIDKKFAAKDLPEKMLQLVIDGNDLLNARDVRQEEVFPEYDWKGWTGLVIGGDWHIEHYRTDARAAIECLKEIGREPHVLYGFNGDAVDVLRLRFIELENETLDIPIRRRKELVKYLFSLVPNTLFAVCGCHDNWMRTRGMQDVIEEIQEVIMGYYLGFGGVINLKAGDVTYRIAAHHKFGFESALNHFHPNYNYLRKIDSSVDVVAISHRHDIVGVAHVYWQEKDRVFVRSGSAQYKTNYAWKEGFRGAINRYPMILLNGTERRMINVMNYREGIQILRLLNEQYMKGKEATLPAGDVPIAPRTKP